MTREEIQSHRFHSLEKKSCKFEARDQCAHTQKVKGRIVPIAIRGGFCETHGVLTCRCGWEWGFHYYPRYEEKAEKLYIKGRSIYKLL